MDDDTCSSVCKMLMLDPSPGTSSLRVVYSSFPMPWLVVSEGCSFFFQAVLFEFQYRDRNDAFPSTSFLGVTVTVFTSSKASSSVPCLFYVPPVFAPIAPFLSPQVSSWISLILLNAEPWYCNPRHVAKSPCGRVLVEFLGINVLSILTSRLQLFLFLMTASPARGGQHTRV
jgi:hypothetical protein